MNIGEKKRSNKQEYESEVETETRKWKKMRRNEDKHGREGGKENRKLKALILKQEMGQM